MRSVLIGLWVALAACQALRSEPFPQTRQGSQPDQKDIERIFSAFGFKVDRKVEQGKCDVEIILDMDKFIPSIPVFQSFGVIRDDIDDFMVSKLPTIISLIIARMFSASVTENLYRDRADVNECRFAQFLEQPDAFGKVGQTPFFRYTFNRDLYNRINWDRFEPENLPRVALTFSLNPFLARKMQQEMEVWRTR